MAIKASRICGLVCASAVGGVVALTGAVSWIFGVIAVIFGVVAIRALLRESIEEFDVGLGEIQPHLDVDWRRSARLACWPRNLDSAHKGGLIEWSHANAAHLELQDAAVLDIARKFYQPDGVLGEAYHLKSRRNMRQIADWWARAGWLASYIRHDVSREGLVMLAYLEIALAERLHLNGASAGRVTEWANLGELWPFLCEREQSAALPPPTTMAPPTTPRARAPRAIHTSVSQTYDALISRIPRVSLTVLAGFVDQETDAHHTIRIVVKVKAHNDGSETTLTDWSMETLLFSSGHTTIHGRTSARHVHHQLNDFHQLVEVVLTPERMLDQMTGNREIIRGGEQVGVLLFHVPIGLHTRAIPESGQWSFRFSALDNVGKRPDVTIGYAELERLGWSR